MEDSGFDSDQRSVQNGIDSKPPKYDDNETHMTSSANGNVRKASELHRKLERQRDAAKKGYSEKAKSGLLSRSRLLVPHSKAYIAAPQSDQQQPLVMLDTDESEDEFSVPRLSAKAQREITQQLIKDGYDLDLEPDDEDLDLIPPRPISERCMCCHMQLNYCTIL